MKDKAIAEITYKLIDLDLGIAPSDLHEILDSILSKYSISKKSNDVEVKTLKEVLGIFLECKKSEMLDIKTINNYKYYFSKFVEFLSNPKLTEITILDLRKFTTSFIGKYKSSTIASKTEMLKAFFYLDS